MRQHPMVLIGVVATACLCAAPASAHHSFSVEFDSKECGEYTGVLTSLDWQNPHPYFYIERKDANGRVETLKFQTSSISNMTRGGTGRAVFMQNMGKTVVARGCAARDRTLNMFAVSWLKFADGIVRRAGQDVEGFFESNN